MLAQLDSWLECKRCGLHEFRRHVVLGEGSMPADLLFVGEAPGKTEDLLALPFKGPAGRVLHFAIQDAIKQAGFEPSYFITNTLACRPTDKLRGNNREPSPDEMLACWPRLQRTEQLVNPRIVILLGRIAEHHCAGRFQITRALQHPSYILRQGGRESTEYRAFVRGLVDIFRELKPKVRRIRRK